MSTKYKQTTSEKKKYTFDYTDWLDASETITLAAASTSDAALIADGESIEVGSQIAYFFVSGGVDGTEYKASLTITTSAGQKKQDTIIIQVEDPF